MYGTAEELRTLTGVQSRQLDLPTDRDLDEQLETWLTEVTDLINHKTRRDFEAEAATSGEPVPPGVINIALRGAANIVNDAIHRRSLGQVSYEDYSTSRLEDLVFTEAILKDLADYMAGDVSWEDGELTATAAVRLLVVRSPREIDLTDDDPAT